MNSPQPTRNEQAPEQTASTMRWHHWAGRLQWIVIPLIILVLANLFVGRISAPTWYPKAKRLAEQRPPDYLFVGSSRTAAAIDASHFAKQIGESVNAFNLGMGYSTPAQHFLGLEQIINAAGGRIDGVTVMIETPRHAREFADWDYRWNHPDRPMLMENVLSPDRLVAYWSSTGSIAVKATTTARWLIKPLPVFSIPHRTGHWLNRQFMEDLPTKLLGASPSGQADMVQDGGIRTDAQAVENAKRIAQQRTNEASRENKRVDFTDDLVITAICDMVHAAGGEVVFYDVPLISFELDLLAKPDRREQTEEFHQFLEAKGTTVLEPPFQYSDADLPDYWHLAASRRLDYTDALLSAYKASLESAQEED